MLKREYPPPTLMVEDEELFNEVEDSGENEKSGEKVVEKEVEGEIDKLIEEGPNEGEFIRRLGKESIIKEATRHPLSGPYP